MSAALVASPALKLRGSVGRAFRAPTFTERFYRDPNHRANERLEPERALGIEGGIDWTPRPDWTTAATLFTRRERNVIDWVRASAAIPWQSANVRTVQVDGFELRTSRVFGEIAGLTVRAELTSVVPDGLPGLSKYVLDFSRQTAAASGWLRVRGGVTAASSVEFRRRSNGRRHTLVQARVSWPWRKVLFFAEGTNLLDIRYQEIAGVEMPGRWLNAGIRVPLF